jgi:hypothetical protein
VVFEEDKAWAWSSELAGKDNTGEPFIFEFSTHIDAGVEVPYSSEDGVLDASQDNGQIDKDDSVVDHDPELRNEEVLVPSPKSAPSPTTPAPATPGSPRTPTGSTTTDTSSESEPLRFRNISSIYRDSVPIDLEYSGLCLLGIEEPANFNEANGVPIWRRAMEEELSSIHDNKTWTLTTLPAGHKAIGLKWVFKLKKDNKGEVVKHRVRLVSKGYVQRQGINFDEVFVPVARLETVRLRIALAAQEG